MTRAEEHEMEQKERAAELEALAMAKKILKEKTGGAAERTYDSFLQLQATTKTRARTRTRGVPTRVVSALQTLAKDMGVPALAQLAVRVRSEVMLGADPFAKVKQMIQEMMEKLLAEAKEEAETKAKRDDKQGEVDDLTTKIDKAAAKIAKLKEEVGVLEKELGEIAAEQKTADEIRASEKAAWAEAKSDFEQGLEGVQMALQVLRDYYAQKEDATELLQGGDSDDLGAAMSLAQNTKSSGAAGGIIGMLEVAESDFSKMLAEGSAAEDQAQKEYDTVTEDNRVTTAAKTTE